MKKIRNLSIVLLTFILTIILLTNSVSAATVNVRTSATKVTLGKSFTVTVSFNEKLAAAQFKLSYDSSKFDYVSVSAGSYNPGTNTFVYINYDDISDLGSVTFSFKAKAVGTGSFNVSGVVLSSNNTVLGNTRSICNSFKIYK